MTLNCGNDALCPQGYRARSDRVAGIGYIDNGKCVPQIEEIEIVFDSNEIHRLDQQFLIAVLVHCAEQFRFKGYWCQDNFCPWFKTGPVQGKCEVHFIAGF